MKNRMFMKKLAERLPAEALPAEAGKSVGLPKPEMISALESAMTEVVMEQKPQPKRSAAKLQAKKACESLFTRHCKQCGSGGLFVFIIGTRA